MQKFLRGYVIVCLEGNSPERFLNLCSFHGIFIWNLEHKNGTYQCCMYISDFKRLHGIIRKTGQKIRIISKVGIPFFLYRNRRRKAAAMGIVLFFVLLYSLSLFVWNIGFEGNQAYTDEVLLNFLHEQGYHHGMLLKTVQCEKLEKAIRNAYGNITWVSVRLDGTRLIVQIKENDLNTGTEEQEENMIKDGSDLVATHEGIVRYIATRHGTPKVHVGDEVKKGTVLVSGTLEILDDYGVVLTTHTVVPDADVIVEYEVEYYEELSRYYMERVYEDENIHSFLQIGNCYMQIPFLRNKSEELEIEQLREVNQFYLFENFYLPIYYGSITQKLYKSEKKLRTEKYMIASAQFHLENYFENLSKLGVEIIENNVRIVVQEEVCLLQGTLVLWDTQIEAVFAQLVEEEEI